MADCVLLGQLQMEEKQFVRDVAVFPEPTIVVATDRQLHDLVRFCTADDVFSVVSIDPTYEHGEYFVTPIGHKHLMLKSNRTGKEPVRVGPVLLHMSKNLHPYYQFACVLCRERKSLKHIKFIGTDGEVNIFKGISLNMEQAGHLRCAVHFRRNIKDQLTALGIKGYDQADFMNEIFGIELEDKVFADGLLNCQDDEEFDHYLAMIEPIWNERQKKLTKEQPSKLFSQYFREHADTIKSSMLAPVRRQAGLGDSYFTTNASESTNHILKQFTEKKQLGLPEFIDKLKKFIELQEEEIANSVIGTGDYTLKPEFEDFLISKDEFFSLPRKDREKAIDRIFNMTVEDLSSRLSTNRIESFVEFSTPISDERLKSTSEEAPTSQHQDDMAHMDHFYSENDDAFTSPILGDMALGAAYLNDQSEEPQKISIEVENSCITVLSQPILRQIWAKTQNLLNSKSAVQPKPVLVSAKSVIARKMESFMVASSKDRGKTYDVDMKDNQKGIIKCSCEMFTKTKF